MEKSITLVSSVQTPNGLYYREYKIPTSESRTLIGTTDLAVGSNFITSDNLAEFWQWDGVDWNKAD